MFIQTPTHVQCILEISPLNTVPFFPDASNDKNVNKEGKYQDFLTINLFYLEPEI